jgi:hypothetical protein
MMALSDGVVIILVITLVASFRACVRTRFPNSVPQGRLNLAQDASPGLDLGERPVPQGRLNLAQDASPGLDLGERPVPQGRLKIGRDAILGNLQPSLRDSIMFLDVPRTSVLG